MSPPSLPHTQVEVRQVKLKMMMERCCHVIDGATDTIHSLRREGENFMKILNKCSRKPYTRFKTLQGLPLLLQTNSLPMVREWEWELARRQHFLCTDWIMGSAVSPNPSVSILCDILSLSSFYGPVKMVSKPGLRIGTFLVGSGKSRTGTVLWQCKFV